jgi:hypothetical protein
MAQSKEKESFGRRWSKLRPTKKVLFWSCVGSVVAVVIIGFGWGGWVTGGNAQKMAEATARDAVVQRLAPICVYQFNQSLEKDQRLQELKESSAYQRRDYVKNQGWATMPGEEEPDSRVADECVKRLMANSQ